MIAHKAVVQLDSGVTAYVTPLTTVIKRVLMVAADQAHPTPDPKPYEVTLHADEALVKDQKIEAEANPEYLRLVKEALQRRQQHYMGLVLDTAVTLDDQDAVLTAYADHIPKLAAAMKGQPIENAMVSPLVSVLIGVLAEESEVGLLMSLAQRALPLDAGEIADGLAYFRPMDLRRHVLRRVNQAQGASSPSEDEPEASAGPAAQ